jgi:ribonuclease P protein component
LNSGYTFKKEERISKQREIDLLFNGASSFTAYPLRVVYVEKKPAAGVPVSILISVPKKRFKRAVKRNRVKRFVRESYRLNKKILYEFLDAEDKGLLIAFIYVSNEIAPFGEIETAMKKALNSLKEKFTPKSPKGNLG